MAGEKFVIHGPASAETVKINETMMMINKINDERHQSSIGSHHKTCLNLTILSLMMSRCQSSRNDKRAPQEFTPTASSIRGAQTERALPVPPSGADG